jgi:hypothetical protein
VLIGADVGDERFPVLAQVPAGGPQHLPQRGLPLGDRVRRLAGGLAIDLALQPQERRGIPDSHLGLAVQDALVSALQDKACQVGGAGRGQTPGGSRWPAGNA